MRAKSACAYDVHFRVLAVVLQRHCEETRLIEMHDVENQRLGAHETNYDTEQAQHDELDASLDSEVEALEAADEKMVVVEEMSEMVVVVHNDEVMRVQKARQMTKLPNGVNPSKEAVEDEMSEKALILQASEIDLVRG
jgi:monoamine oxidase